MIIKHKKSAPLVSVIIRAKNEERWITFCLDMVYKQTHKNLEVILVNNQSTDHTLKLAKKWPVKVVDIDKYIPGKALNLGIQASKGEYIVCLSAHCIPKDEHWLANLLRNFENEQIVGTYGRQEPLASSSPEDKRDLIMTFGLDSRIQKKDHLFHNANSMIRRSMWERFPFAEDASNIEDRIWGKQVIEAGFHIAYEPDASVFRHIGIHQKNNHEREAGVTKMIEQIEGHLSPQHVPDSLNPKNLHIAALLPIIGRQVKIGRVDLLKRCAEFIKKSPLVKEVCVLTDTRSVAQDAKKWGVKAIMRPASLSASGKTIEDALKFGLDELIKKGSTPDAILFFNYQFPFHPSNLIEILLHDLLHKGVDSVIPGTPEYGAFWVKTENDFKRLDEGFMNRTEKNPLMQGLIGLGCATMPRFVSEGHLFGPKVGIFEITDPKHRIRIIDDKDAFNKKIAELFLKKE